MSDHPYVANPEAIGDPDQTPVVVLPSGPAGDFMRSLVNNNRRLWMGYRCSTCNGMRRDHESTDHGHEFSEKPHEQVVADRLADIASGAL